MAKSDCKASGRPEGHLKRPEKNPGGARTSNQVAVYSEGSRRLLPIGVKRAQHTVGAGLSFNQIQPTGAATFPPSAAASASAKPKGSNWFSTLATQHVCTRRGANQGFDNFLMYDQMPRVWPLAYGAARKKDLPRQGALSEFERYTYAQTNVRNLRSDRH